MRSWRYLGDAFNPKKALAEHLGSFLIGHEVLDIRSITTESFREFLGRERWGIVYRVRDTDSEYFFEITSNRKESKSLDVSYCVPHRFGLGGEKVDCLSTFKVGNNWYDGFGSVFESEELAWKEPPVVIDGMRMARKLYKEVQNGATRFEDVVHDCVQGSFREGLKERFKDNLLRYKMNYCSDIYSFLNIDEREMGLPRLSESGCITSAITLTISLKKEDCDKKPFSGDNFPAGVYQEKSLKSQVNHIFHFILRLSPSIFRWVLDKLNGEVPQPYRAIDGLTPCFLNIMNNKIKYCSSHKLFHKQRIEAARIEKHPHDGSLGRTPEGCIPFDNIIDELTDAEYEDNLCRLIVSQNQGVTEMLGLYGRTGDIHGYIDVMMSLFGYDKSTAKKEAERMLGVSKWKREDALFIIVQEIFKGVEVLREASPSWLGRQRLDIYIPTLSLAIEHQGIQHYKAMGHWGGEEALIKNQERDKIKRDLCKKNGVYLCEIRYDQSVTESSIRHRLCRYITR